MDQGPGLAAPNPFAFLGKWGKLPTSSMGRMLQDLAWALTPMLL